MLRYLKSLGTQIAACIPFVGIGLLLALVLKSSIPFVIGSLAAVVIVAWLQFRDTNTQR